MTCFLPWNYTNHTDIHSKIKDCNTSDRNKHAPRNGLARIHYFSAEVTYIIISQEAINGFYRCLAQHYKKYCSCDRVTYHFLYRCTKLTMSNAATNNPEHGSHNTDP